MQLTAHFVEYLIIGSLSLLWLVPLFPRQLLEPYLPLAEKSLIALLPSFYCVGMAIDALGHMLTNWHRKHIRAAASHKYSRRYDAPPIEHATADVDLLLLSTELARAAEVRTTRARIARGAVTNALLAAVVWLPRIAPGLLAHPWRLVLAFLSAAATIVLLWAMWARWQRISFRFEIKAIAMAQRASSASRGIPSTRT